MSGSKNEKIFSWAEFIYNLETDEKKEREWLNWRNKELQVRKTGKNGFINNDNSKVNLLTWKPDLLAMFHNRSTFKSVYNQKPINKVPHKMYFT